MRVTLEANSTLQLRRVMKYSKRCQFVLRIDVLPDVFHFPLPQYRNICSENYMVEHLSD